jgi:RimJ/RimL family protein N-acetyltransferase
VGDIVVDALTTIVDEPVCVPSELTTARLVLRRWRESDLGPMAAINADPDVMRHFSSSLSHHQTARQIAAYEASFARNGYGPWAVTIAGTSELVGLMGLLPVEFDAHFTPAVQVIARFAAPAWRQGYASEASQAMKQDAFERVGLDEMVAFTVRSNEPSQRLMAANGMTHDPADDFMHPGLDEGSPYRDHVLYRLRNPRLGGTDVSR